MEGVCVKTFFCFVHIFSGCSRILPSLLEVDVEDLGSSSYDNAESWTRTLASAPPLSRGVSIGFLNLSLGFNSVGFYQMTKLAIIPCTVFIQTSFYGKVFSTRVKAALAVLLGGGGAHSSSSSY